MRRRTSSEGAGSERSGAGAFCMNAAVFQVTLAPRRRRFKKIRGRSRIDAPRALWLNAHTFAAACGSRWHLTHSDSRPPTLIVTGGPQDGVSIDCSDGQKAIGSAADAQVRIQSANVGSKHARLEWDGLQLSITDVGSTTGTFVNGEKITDTRSLSEGDRVYLGPPGSSDSASLLVCPPESSSENDLLLDPLPGFSAPDAEPLLLDPPDAGPLDLSPPIPPPPPSADADPLSKPLPLVPPPTGSIRPAASARTGDTSSIRRPTKADFSDQIPSIGGDRVREPIQLPPAAPIGAAPRKGPAGRKGGGSPLDVVPRPVLIGVGTLILLLVPVVGYFFFHAPAPVLSGVNPMKAEPGGALTVTGQDFGDAPSKNTVRFGDVTGEVTSASPTQLVVTIPAQVTLGNVPVTVQTRGGTSNSLLLDVFKGPHVTSLSPEVAMPGTEVVLTGKNLNTAKPIVMVAGREGEVLQAQPTSIRFRVPSGFSAVEGKTVPVSVQVGNENARPVQLLVGHLPLLTELAPVSGPIGTRVTLRGRGFAAEAGANKVRFGDKRTLVIAGTATELTVVVPGSDLSGSQLNVDIRVETAGSTSSPKPFILMRQSGVFLPRFYGEPAPDAANHDHVFLSTDLGPALILTGKGDAASSTARALKAADALNEAIDAVVAGKPAGIEVREKESCLAITGASSCFVTATAEDAAAYDEAWTSTKSARSTPKVLAAHWGALVDDLLLLFVRKQRPYRVLETSTRGKVLLEIYAEAARTAGAGQGVPSPLVNPLPPRLVAPLREMALVLPGEGQARSAAAIEGLWSGTVDDAGTTRPIRVRFRMDNGKPQGSLTTRQGQLAMDVPLTDVAYERGTVRFGALLSGQVTTFKGQLDQGAIKGTTQHADAKQPAGQFTLSFVE
jgi:hypothetical protein